MRSSWPSRPNLAPGCRSPCRPDVLLGLPVEHRLGTWNVVRADFPHDGFAHVRHLAAGQSCGTSSQTHARCPVQDIATGSWADATAKVRELFPDLHPANY